MSRYVPLPHATVAPVVAGAFGRAPLGVVPAELALSGHSMTGATLQAAGEVPRTQIADTQVARLEKGHVFLALVRPREMHCRNHPSRGTISASREPCRLMCPWGRADGYLFYKIELKVKQLTGCVVHLCKEGDTRISPGKLP
jgi:hypothetical protein